MTTDDVTLIEGDCLEKMRDIASGSVSLIATDPPYYRVKTDEEWDRQWETPEKFLEWMGMLCAEWKRVLAPNGSLYVFASHEMAWGVEGEIRKRFNVLNRAIWRKPPFSTKAEMFRKEDLRAFFPASEAVIFAEQENITGKMLRQARKNQGLSSNDLGSLYPSITGNPTGCVRNWELGLNTPSPQQWETMAEILDLPSYEEAIRPFNVSADVPYTDVWDFPTVPTRPGKHPCEKPLDLISHIVSASSRPGDLVLDCFGGSGVTARACLNLGRRCILIEKDPHWVKAANIWMDRPHAYLPREKRGSAKSSGTPLFSGLDV